MERRGEYGGCWELELVDFESRSCVVRWGRGMDGWSVCECRFDRACQCRRDGQKREEKRQKKIA